MVSLTAKLRSAVAPRSHNTEVERIFLTYRKAGGSKHGLNCLAEVSDAQNIKSGR